MTHKSYAHTAQYYETDKMGIIHHSNYIRWMEEARVDFLAQIGWDYAKLEEMGIASPVTAVECKYKTPTTFSETVRILVAVEEWKGVRLKLRYTMANAVGQTVCEGTSEHCFLDKEGRLLRLSKAHPEFDKALRELAQEQNSEEEA